MEQVRKIFVWSLIFFLGIQLNAQRKTGIHQYLVRTTGTFGFGYGAKETQYSLQGEAGFLLSSKVELNGAINIGMGSSNRNSLDYFQGNTINLNPGDYRWHGYWAGFKYHFLTDKHADFYLGLQPGMGLVLVQPHISAQLGNQKRQTGIAPVVTECAGIAYYASIFHVYAELRLIQGKYQSPEYSLPMNEIRLSVGLGLNLN